MIRLVAALLLVFLGTVHTWAGGDGGFFASPLLSREHVVAGYGAPGPMGHIADANKLASLNQANECCPELFDPVVSFSTNCMFATVIGSLPDVVICPDLARGATSSAPGRSGLDGTASIFRPPII